MKVLVAPLNNGVLMPAVGLGTYKSDQAEAIFAALKHGYCAVDTAECYENYSVIKSALKTFESSRPKQIDSSATSVIKNPNEKAFKVVDEDTFLTNMRQVPHGESPDKHTVFVTTKVWLPLSAEKVRATAERFHEECDRKQGDLILLHWPAMPKELIKPGESAEDNIPSRRLEAWRELEKLYHEKKFRAIGVSNFMESHMEQLLNDIDRRKKEGDKYAMYPAINQIEISPWLKPSQKLSDLCAKYNIYFTAYSPLRARHVLESISHPVFVELSKKYSKPPAVIILRFLLQRGITVIPKSNNLQRVIDNYQLFDFELEESDMKKADINDGLRSCMNPYLLE